MLSSEQSPCDSIKISENFLSMDSTNISLEDENIHSLYDSNYIIEVLEAIHQCVLNSTIRHVLAFPLSIIIEYFSTYPFFCGADTLYYLVLRKAGEKAHYAKNNRHIVSIQPELAGVYILAEQNMKAPLIRNIRATKLNNKKCWDDLQSSQSAEQNSALTAESLSPNETIYPIIKASIDRTITCNRYKIRHSIITGEASIKTATIIPTIALNIPRYQSFYQQSITIPEMTKILIDQDCWEPIKTLNFTILSHMIYRMILIKSISSQLWKHSLREYYTNRLKILNIHDSLPVITSRQIYSLHNILPDLVRFPSGLNTLGIRLWFTERMARAYLLGFDIYEGIPSDEIVCERIQRLQRLGIEKFTDEITGVYVDNDNKLTGRIGTNFYHDFVGKTLVNTKTAMGTSIGTYYVCDLIPVISGDSAYILTLYDFINAFDTNDRIFPETVQRTIIEGKIPFINEDVGIDEAKKIFDRIFVKMDIVRGIPARTRLVEIMSHDVINY